jgi:large subunit ribosomal protein L7/L12
MSQIDVSHLSARIAKLERQVAFLLKKLELEYVDHPDMGVSPDIWDAVQRGNKIEAIKLYREQSGLGLKEAKDFIDSLG